MAHDIKTDSVSAPGIIEIGAIISSVEGTLTFLRQHGILQDQCTCETCQRQMVYIAKKEGRNGEIFRCSKCKAKKTIRYGSICEVLQYANMPLQYTVLFQG